MDTKILNDGGSADKIAPMRLLFETTSFKFMSCAAIPRISLMLLLTSLAESILNEFNLRNRA